MKVYSKASADVLSHIARMQSNYHPDLQEVTVDAVFVFDDEANSESVLKHQGYSAAAVVRITPVRDACPPNWLRKKKLPPTREETGEWDACPWQPARKDVAV